jgi:hypothetical protein
VTPVDVIRSYLAAMQHGDRDAAFAHYADDVVAHVPGRSPLAGERRGRAAMEDYVRAAVVHAHGRVETTLLDVLVGERHVALLLRERLVGEDAVLDMRRTNVYRVEDDRIAEVGIFEGDQHAVDAFFADADARP